MGGGNPIKQITRAATDVVEGVVVNPIRETARVVGADGVVEAADQLNAGLDHIGTQTGEVISGENVKRDKERAAAAGAAQAVETERQVQEDKKQKDEANAEIERDRMAAGSRSRTLLTGPRGLEDEEGVTISRRTLGGRARAARA